jgi:hypothetical protein
MSQTKLFENGYFRSRAVEHTFGKADTGTRQVAVTFKVLEGPDEGRNITWRGYFKEGGDHSKTIEQLMIAGWDGEDITTMDGLGSCDVVLNIADEEYKGDLYSRVKWVNEPGSGGPTVKNPMNAEEMAMFAESMKGAVLAVKQRREKGASAVDDDVPFAV